jgi:hypothetical protein
MFYLSDDYPNLTSHNYINHILLNQYFFLIQFKTRIPIFYPNSPSHAKFNNCETNW